MRYIVDFGHAQKIERIAQQLNTSKLKVIEALKNS